MNCTIPQVKKVTYANTVSSTIRFYRHVFDTSLESHVPSELVRKAISTDAQRASRPSVYFSVY
jgi:predicted enzyme related to lactoylglutathione lyase